MVSTAGRDKGLFMAVLEAQTDGVFVADGRKRPVQHPKRKNPCHVAATGFTVSDASMATNRELRRALAAVREQLPASPAAAIT